MRSETSRAPSTAVRPFQLRLLAQRHVISSIFSFPLLTTRRPISLPIFRRITRRRLLQRRPTAISLLPTAHFQDELFFQGLVLLLLLRARILLRLLLRRSLILI